jgi:hypothetical protein
MTAPPFPSIDDGIVAESQSMAWHHAANAGACFLSPHQIA